MRLPEWKIIMHESGEMYLETIYVLSQNSQSVRSLDVAEHCEFNKPSVRQAIGNIKEGYVISDSGGYLKNFTQSGMEAAGNIYERHIILTKMPLMIGVDEETAAADACKMEHYISEKSFNAIKEHMQNTLPKPNTLVFYLLLTIKAFSYIVLYQGILF